MWSLSGLSVVDLIEDARKEWRQEVGVARHDSVKQRGTGLRGRVMGPQHLL